MQHLPSEGLLGEVEGTQKCILLPAVSLPTPPISAAAGATHACTHGDICGNNGKQMPGGWRVLWRGRRERVEETFNVETAEPDRSYALICLIDAISATCHPIRVAMWKFGCIAGTIPRSSSGGRSPELWWRSPSSSVYQHRDRMWEPTARVLYPIALWEAGGV